MSDTQNYVEWRPEYDGHAPPYWREGMACNGQGRRPLPHAPAWLKGFLYCVPSEALTAPNDDAVAKWKVADAADIASMVESLRQYPADELAKHGITLAEPKDWATELWADLWEARGSPEDAELVRSGETSIADRAAIELLRQRFEQMKGEG